MAACSLKNDLLLLVFIDKQPVRFDVTIPSPLVVSCQFMVSAGLRKLLFQDKQADDFFIFFLSLPLFSIFLRSRSNCLVYVGQSI